MSRSAQFETTRWSLVHAARDADGPTARAALADLCHQYWFPIYSFIRSRGADDHRAQDLTQEFFKRLLERDGLARVDPQRGRFRSYLLGACQHFLANQHEFDSAQKRGGGREPIALDFASADSRFGLEPTGGRTPEQEFERRWALALLDQALSALRAEYGATGRTELFDHLKGTLTGDARPFAQLGEELGLTEGAVKVAAHRLRMRYRDCLRALIRDTVADEQEIDDEIRALFQALSL